MSTIQVEVVSGVKSDGYVLGKDDRVTLPEEIARRWCGAGWARAVNGEVPTGDRVVVRAVIEPDSAVHAHTAEEVTGG